jgi:hypothetical protein
MANTHEVFHGTEGANILNILKDGSIRPDVSHEVYFSTRFEDALQHGADMQLHASFAFRGEVTIVSGASVQRVSRPGNPSTMLVTTTLPLPISIVELYVRLGRAGEFELKQVKGAAEIKAYLLLAQKAGHAS